MAAKDRAAKAGKAASAARSNPYVQRLIADEQLRENIRTAYEAGRSAYGRMNNGKAPTRALMEDKKLQKELRNAAQALSEAGSALRESPKKRRRGGLGRMLVVGLVGAGLALALSDGLRSKVLDMLFGSEEEFDYTSTTAPATPAPEPAVAG
jgi:ferric-dicitrate binding protein FerR (iron transport regulator)